MARVFESDKLRSGTHQIAMEGESLSVLIAPEVGGRIVDLRGDSKNFLHRIYPKGVQFGPYTEYGGIEECVGGAPGEVWNTPWVYERRGVKNQKVTLWAYSRNVLVKKSIILEDSEPILNIAYELLNVADEPTRLSFGIHPEISMWGKFKDSEYHIPVNGDITSGVYTRPGEKMDAEPSHSWCAVSYKDSILGQFFPSSMDVVKIYYPRVDTHIVMQPVIYGLEIPGQRKAVFYYMLYAGAGDVETIREIHRRRHRHKSIHFQPFKPDEVIKCEACGALTTTLHRLDIRGKSAKVCERCRAEMEAIPSRARTRVRRAPRPAAKPSRSRVTLEKEAVLRYYSRTDVQKAMFQYARGRQLTTMRSFGTPRISHLRNPGQIMSIIESISNHKWPSIHGTVRRMGLTDRVWDVVFEADYKSDWSIAFESVRPVVQLFLRIGVPFFVKYSGNSSPHIIIPGEAFRPHVSQFNELPKLYRRVYTFVRKNMKRPNTLDMSFLNSSRHYLRLAYSVHEHTGRVSLPILPRDYDSFTPGMAHIQNVVVMEDWWHIPEDAGERGAELVLYLSRQR